MTWIWEIKVRGEPRINAKLLSERCCDLQKRREKSRWVAGGGESKARRGPELLTCLFRAGSKSFEYEMRYLEITMYSLAALK